MEYLRKNKPNNDADSEHCKLCAGGCCKRYAGATYPDDFERPLSVSLVKAFRSGNWSIDWWEPASIYDDQGDWIGTEPTIYYVRPAHTRVKWPGSLFDPSWGGTCVFLTESGCRLPADTRPVVCRDTHRVSPEKCHGEANKKSATDAWEPFQAVIRHAARKAKGDQI